MSRSPSLAMLLIPALLAVAIGTACSTPRPTQGQRYEFFSDAKPGEVWYGKVAAWQQRARSAPITIEAAARRGNQGTGLIRTELGRFASTEKRALARRVNTWSQAEARSHYRLEDDDDPANDHWPTFGELLKRNGDDCDGLDLMAYELLREFGFSDVYRAIVHRDGDQTNHMVTLWFEDSGDPWVLDATGAIVTRMRRFSDLPLGWTPTKVFDERAQFKVTDIEASDRHD